MNEPVTHLEKAWQEFVTRQAGTYRCSDGQPPPVFTDTRTAFHAGFAAGAGLIDRLADVIVAAGIIAEGKKK